jgi:hypothetical protein
MKKNINVVLRTCDRVSLADDRIVPKDKCILYCLRSLVKSLENYGSYTIHVIDDNSSKETRDNIISLVGSKNVTLLEHRDEEHLSNKQKSRFSVKVAYDYIKTLPEDELVYVVEDDYLHYSNSIEKMIEAWHFLSDIDNSVNIGIFPQDFTQLYLHPLNPYNSTYIQPCYIVAGPDRYYRTTWFTHESFMIQKSVISKYQEHFDEQLKIGYEDGKWEGNSISKVWGKSDVLMFMPMKTLAYHVSKKEDLSFYGNDFEQLLQENSVDTTL